MDVVMLPTKIRALTVFGSDVTSAALRGEALRPLLLLLLRLLLRERRRSRGFRDIIVAVFNEDLLATRGYVL